MSRTRLALIAASILSAAPAVAMFRRPQFQDVPVDRLIKNTEAYIAKHPDDAQGPYTLGRLNYLAFIDHTTELSIPYTGAKPSENELPDFHSHFQPHAAPGHEATDAQRAGYLQGAVQQLKKATKLEPKKGLYWLTLASALEQGAPAASLLKATSGLPPGDEALRASKPQAKQSKLVSQLLSSDAAEQERARQALTKESCPAAPAVMKALAKGKHTPPQETALKGVLERCWKERAIDAYWTAFQLSLAHDEKTGGGLVGEPILSEEAGTGYERLVNERGATPEEKKRLEEIKSGIEKVHHHGRPITPIVLSLESAQPLSELVATTSVHFDLDGSGLDQRWTWVKPTTGLLVWDPRQTGRISSGQQLLGAVSFQMFWRTGYDALDALDDNRDGRLSGDELTGLAVWFDRNSNGVSEPGEVVPVEALGIVGLATSVTGHEGEAPMNGRGVFLKDGRVLPTYDWIAHPVPEVAER